MNTKLVMFGTLYSVALLGCSYHPGSDMIKKNACVSAGASYLEHYTQLSGGTCGEVSDVVINVPENGEIELVGCAGVPRYVGCDVYLDNIKCKSNGFDVIQNGKMSWAQDGSSGEGTITITISNNNSSCVSSYDIKAKRL